MPRLHSGAAIDRPETTKLPPIPGSVWQQPQETHLKDMYKNSTTNINNSTHTPKFKQEIDAESQTSPIQEISPQVSGSDTESPLQNQTGSTPVQCLIDSTKQQPETQRNETDMKTPDRRDDNVSPKKYQLHKLKNDL